jgi:hypothetical protein
MKRFIEKIVFFVANSLRADTSESSKRLFGALGFMCFILAIYIWRHDLVETLGWISAALLGLDVVMQGVSNIKSNKKK